MVFTPHPGELVRLCKTDMEAYKKKRIQLLKLAAENETVAVGGLFTGEMPADKVPEDIDGWESIRDRLYGKTRLHIWRRTK